MKTILVFDVWLPGFSYIKELADEPGVKVVFVHTSSLQTGQPRREYESFRRQMQQPSWVHDFSEFDYCFSTLFERTQPDALLVLSLHHIEARTALYFAKHHGISTYFIPHGIFLLGDKPFGHEEKKGIFLKLSLSLKMLPRAGYYIRFFSKFHEQMVRTGLRALQPLATLSALLELISRYYHWQWHPSAKAQGYYGPLIDNLILYDSSISKYYQQSYGIMVKGANTIASGTLDTTRLIRGLRGKELSPIVSEERNIVYFISSPYPDYFSHDNTAIYAEILLKLNNAVIDAGFDGLIYRAHPGEPAEFSTRVCQIARIDRDKNPGLSDFISAKAICGTSSSMLYCAVIMAKPIIIWSTTRLTVCPPYYEPLMSYSTISFDADAECNDEALQALHRINNASPELDISKLKDPIADLVQLVLCDEKP
jgi:hypothetical protein